MPQTRLRTAIAALAMASSLVACTGNSPYGSAKGDAKSSDKTAQRGPTEASPKLSASAAAAAKATAHIRANGNHLVGQPSPYLEQHSHNPVDWHPWGDEALAKAKQEGKPIFLSIGYSTCHWCHVMEKESFEDDEVAAFLNEHFISIKVDREQRPDVDALYIDAVGAMGGSTGWPLTVFLTPNLEPFFGGTYYPRHPKQGRPGFMDILHKVQAMYADEGPAVASRGRDVLEQIERRALGAAQRPGQIERTVVEAAMKKLTRNRDSIRGGFGSRQKFPNTPLLDAELRWVWRSADADAREHLVLTLDEMLRGGVRDHVGGSFHRYAVDARWHLPHFEKTLYDNAQLARLYVAAGRYLEREDFVAAGRAVLDDLVANWRGAGRGFIVGFDADDPGGEGAFYSWTPAELDEVLGKADGRIFATTFDVGAPGIRELGGRSVLHRLPWSEAATKLDLDETELRAVIARSLPKLDKARSSRPKPGQDDKVLVGWNGLAIAALADVGRWLDEPRYIEAAAEAANFVLEDCWEPPTLARGFRDKDTLGPGFLEDYALAGLGLLRLHAATGDPRWLDGAHTLAEAVSTRFYDAEKKAFMQTATAQGELPVRLADLSDGVLPSGGSAAMMLCLQVGVMSGDESIYEIGYEALRRSVGAASGNPFSAGYLLQVIDHALGPVREVVIAGDDADPVTAALWKTLSDDDPSHILPIKIPGSGAPIELARDFEALEGKRALKGTATAFVCQRGSCQAPTSDPAKLRAQLDKALAEVE